MPLFLPDVEKSGMKLESLHDLGWGWHEMRLQSCSQLVSESGPLAPCPQLSAPRLLLIMQRVWNQEIALKLEAAAGSGLAATPVEIWTHSLLLKLQIVLLFTVPIDSAFQVRHLYYLEDR